MSSILKALRKAEDEKATAGEGSVDLAHDILKRSYDQRISVPWGLVSFAGLVLVVLAAAGWLLFPRVQTPTSIVAQQPHTVALPPAKVQPGVLPVEKIKDKLVEQTIPSAPQPVAIRAPKQSPAPALETGGETLTSAKRPDPVAILDLQVDEIVYHADPVSRLAIINDLPVMVGTDIGGARVEEILSDRVRFSYRGGEFIRFKNSNSSKR